MSISQLRCNECGVSVSGNFDIPHACLLPQDLYDFMLVFLKNRGNIKDIEKELGISYPTVRSRLDALLENLGFKPAPVNKEVEDIIAKLESGEITAEEAEKLIKKSKES
jgi:hypothetical protein